MHGLQQFNNNISANKTKSAIRQILQNQCGIVNPKGGGTVDKPTMPTPEEFIAILAAEVIKRQKEKEEA